MASFKGWLEAACQCFWPLYWQSETDYVLLILPLILSQKKKKRSPGMKTIVVKFNKIAWFSVLNLCWACEHFYMWPLCIELLQPSLINSTSLLFISNFFSSQCCYCCFNPDHVLCLVSPRKPEHVLSVPNLMHHISYCSHDDRDNMW